MNDSTELFPDAQWTEASPEAVGLDSARLEAARQWQDQGAEGRPRRVAVVRRGQLAAHWCSGIEADQPRAIASAAKSVFSCMLGIAIDEGMIGSADDKVVEYYPEMMDVPEGAGPKEGRFARPKDAAITFRHLISNTSGYLKPNEEPGQVFHYQTYGMNILCHAIATRYGYYDSSDPQRLPGFGALVAEKIRDAIGATWTHTYMNFTLPAEAKINIFGNYSQIVAPPLDMARLGLLWLRNGRWNDRQVVPAHWMADAVRVAPAIRAHAPEDQWTYGLGFWTNESGRMLGDLPTDSFAARGAGANLIWVCPSLDLVVVESPGLFAAASHEYGDMITRIAGAVRD